MINTTYKPFLASAALSMTLFAAALSSANATVVVKAHGTMAEHAAAMREIKIDASTKAINVSRHETVRFVNAAGEKFTWQFDTLHHPVIALSKLAPAGFAMKEVFIYVGQGEHERN